MITYPPDLDIGVLWELAEQRGVLDRRLRELDREGVPANDHRRKTLTKLAVAHLEACRGYGVQFDGEPKL
jgi:hypothetical protein